MLAISPHWVSFNLYYTLSQYMCLTCWLPALWLPFRFVHYWIVCSSVLGFVFGTPSPNTLYFVLALNSTLGISVASPLPSFWHCLFFIFFVLCLFITWLFAHQYHDRLFVPFLKHTLPFPFMTNSISMCALHFLLSDIAITLLRLGSLLWRVLISIRTVRSPTLQQLSQTIFNCSISLFPLTHSLHMCVICWLPWI